MVVDGKKRQSHHHWAARCKLDFASEFDAKGIPLEENAVEANQRELHELEHFFGMEDVEIRGSIKETCEFAVNAFSSIGKRRQSVSAQIADSGEVPKLNLLSAKWQNVARRASGQELDPAKLAGQVEPPDAGPTGSISTKAFALTDAHIAQGSPPVTAESQLSGKSRVNFTGRENNDSDSDGDYGDQPIMCGVKTAAALSREMYHTIDQYEWMKEKTVAKQVRDRIHRPVTPKDILCARQPVALSVNDFPPIFSRPDRVGEKPRETHYEYFHRRIPEEQPDRRRVMKRRAQHVRVLYGGAPPPRGGWEDLGRDRAQTEYGFGRFMSEDEESDRPGTQSSSRSARTAYKSQSPNPHGRQSHGRDKSPRPPPTPCNQPSPRKAPGLSPLGKNRKAARGGNDLPPMQSARERATTN